MSKDERRSGPGGGRGLTRRAFLRGAATAGVALGLGTAERGWAQSSGPSARARPGRVVEVHKPGSIVGTRPVAAAVGEMVEAGMLTLTGAGDLAAAWKRFVGPADTVGIKVNSLGGPQCSTSPEMVREIIRGLKSAGVAEEQIVVFDRFGLHLRRVGYRHNPGPQGVRSFGSEGWLSPAGYDPEVYYEADPGPDRRSHLTNIVTRMVTRLINVPVLKDHNVTGITAALKNVAFGVVNNTARFHPLGGDPAVADIWAMPQVGAKVVVTLLEALRAQFDQGPVGNANFSWNPARLFLSVDPVALDTVALRVIEEKRAAEGLPPITGSHRPAKHILTAASRGLGVGEWSKIDLVTVDLPPVAG